MGRLLVPHSSPGSQEDQEQKDFVKCKVLQSQKGWLWIRSAPDPGLSQSVGEAAHRALSLQVACVPYLSLGLGDRILREVEGLDPFLQPHPSP